MAVASTSPIPSTTPSTSDASIGRGRIDPRQDNVPLEPGTYEVDFDGGGAYPTVVYTVPSGWTSDGGWLSKHIGTDRLVGVTFWNPVEVYAHPCDWQQPRVRPGPSVDDFVEAVTAQPLRNATAPEPVTLGGYEGKRLTWSVPSDIDFATCDVVDGEGAFESWTASALGSDRYQQMPGQVDHLWVLDIDGVRLVVDATANPGASAEDVAEMAAIVDSLRFEPSQGS
jgi:hypothetical protein